MNAFTYGLLLQWKLDIRSKSLLITCYGVPLIFFLLMGGIFTSVMPEMKHTLIPAMIILGVSMGALIGLPPSLSETCSPSVKKVFRANGVPLYLPLAALFLSAFLHLMLLSVLILLLAPALFDAVPPANLFLFFAALAVYTQGVPPRNPEDFSGVSMQDQLLRLNRFQPFGELPYSFEELLALAAFS